MVYFEKDIAETLVSLRLARRASLSEIVRNISPRLDLTDYTPYNLAKEGSLKEKSETKFEFLFLFSFKHKKFFKN